jgi:hypothetical protein
VLLNSDNCYRSTDCQTAPWRNGHKEACKSIQARREFHRAGDILQERFYEYRERVFDRRIIKVEAGEGDKWKAVSSRP